MRRLVTMAALSATTLLSPASPCLAQEDAAAATTGLMEQWSEDIAHAYLQAWSSTTEHALSDVPELYAPKISYYGRLVGQPALRAEKRRFAARWPIRRYDHRPGTMTIRCDVLAKACLVRSVVDWEVRSPTRNASSRGVSAFELGVGFSGPKPTVTSENGRVISR